MCASCRGRPGPRRQASIWYHLPGPARGIITVIVSVPPRTAHQPPRVLLSTAPRPATVVVAFGIRQFGRPIGVPPDEDSPGRQDADRVGAGLGDPAGAGTGHAGAAQTAGAQVHDQPGEVGEAGPRGDGPPGRRIPERQAHGAEARGGRRSRRDRSRRVRAGDAGAAGGQRNQGRGGEPIGSRLDTIMTIRRVPARPVPAVIQRSKAGCPGTRAADGWC